MPVDAAVPVIVVSTDFRYYEVTASEFGRLLSGAPGSSPDAPAGYEYQGYWAAMVEVADGTVMRGEPAAVLVIPRDR